jgi:hypothetical protein
MKYLILILSAVIALAGLLMLGIAFLSRLVGDKDAAGCASVGVVLLLSAGLFAGAALTI